VLAAGIALLVIGLLLGLFLGYAGFIVAVVGLVLLILALVGVGRRSAPGEP
jgi:hypothetical protein